MKQRIAIAVCAALVVAAFLTAVALGVAAFVKGRSWIGGVAAVPAILIGLFFPFTMAISRQEAASDAIRVGDTVTVGEISGTVTRIQIRATTIRGWDNKELLVPNREFITGRLLNWTLSDRVIRLTLVVGVAYGTDMELALRLVREAADATSAELTVGEFNPDLPNPPALPGD